MVPGGGEGEHTLTCVHDLSESQGQPVLDVPYHSRVSGLGRARISGSWTFVLLNSRLESRRRRREVGGRNTTESILVNFAGALRPNTLQGVLRPIGKDRTCVGATVEEEDLAVTVLDVPYSREGERVNARTNTHTRKQADSTQERIADLEVGLVSACVCLWPCATFLGPRGVSRTVSLRTRCRRYTSICMRYRGTSIIRNCPPPQDHHRALGMVLL